MIKKKNQEVLILNTTILTINEVMINIKLKKIGWNMYIINWIEIKLIIKKIVMIL